MIMLTMLGFLGATVLAFRFNVLILLPSTLFGWLVVVVCGVATASSGMSIVSNLVLVAVALQFGYLFGFVFKWGTLASRRRSFLVKSAAVPDSTFYKISPENHL